MKIDDTFHLASVTDEHRPVCGACLTKWVSPAPLPEVAKAKVNCPDCLRIMDQKPVTLGQYWTKEKTMHFIRNPKLAAYRCGARDGAGTSQYSEVTCSDCLELIQGVGTPTPHTPPVMGDGDNNADGVFTFTDTHIQGCTMEVVPQTTGNVEITVSYGPDDGYMFTLHHLDRADLLRALLYDFHYSPERGGPNDQV